jgi:hypothetical protein
MEICEAIMALDRIAQALACIVCTAQQKTWPDHFGFFNCFEAEPVAFDRVHQ